jgi:hypothetical protein
MNREHPQPMRPRRSGSFAACALAALMFQAAHADPRCTPAASASKDVVGAMESLYSSLRGDDLKGFREITTSDFHAYDGGAQFEGDALAKLIIQLHASGKQFEWSIVDPRVHVTCDTAWVTYVNRGWVQDSTGRQNMTWLESAVLQLQGGQWRVRFFHSTRAANPVKP